MATAMVNGKRAQLSISSKARLLQVIDIHEPGVLAVRSATDSRTAYAIYHDGKKTTGCACTHCKVSGKGGCSYRLAADWYLEAQRRNAYCDTFGIYA